MNKKEKEFLNEINEKLNKLNEVDEVPELLREENIVAAVTKEEQVKLRRMSSKSKSITSISTIAAAIVLIVCCAIAYKTSQNLPPVVAVSPNAEDFGEAPLIAVNEYSALEEIFLGYATELRESQKWYSGILNDKNDAYQETTAVGNATNESDTSTTVTSDNYGKTNIQVEGVDEADVLKNDGQYLYLVTKDYLYNKLTSQYKSGIVKILDAKDPSKVTVVSSVCPEIEENKTLQIDDIYISKNRLVVLCTAYDKVQSAAETDDAYEPYALSDKYCSNYSDTLAIIYDITDKANPKEVNRFSQDGITLSSRLIGDRLYIITNYYVNLYTEDDVIKQNCIPQVGQNGSTERILTDNICVMQSSKGQGYLVVSSININNEDLDIQSKAILGGGSDAYCTEDSLYISNSVYATNEQLLTEFTEEIALIGSNSDAYTEVFSFKLNAGKIEYNSYGRVLGTVLNQFSMDEYNGYFRIATSIGWNGTNNLTVLDKTLKRVGSIDNLANGERIYAVRFLGNTGYVVTFRQTDPLFVIDLSEPTKPTVVGKLEVPGFSNYLHPYSENYLIGIGTDGDETGTNGKLKVSLFDITDPKNPKEVSKITVANASSEVANNPKAFLSIGENNFAIPVYSSAFKNGSYRAQNQCMIFTVENGKLKTLQKIVDTPFEYTDDAGVKNSVDSYSHRATYIGDTIFTISDYNVKAFSMTSGKVLSDVAIYKPKTGDENGGNVVNPVGPSGSSGSSSGSTGSSSGSTGSSSGSTGSSSGSTVSSSGSQASSSGNANTSGGSSNK